MSAKQTRGTVDLTKLRKSRGDRTPQEVSTRANVGAKMYSEIEDGTRNDPPVSVMYRIATALGVKVEDLLRIHPGDDTSEQ